MTQGARDRTTPVGIKDLISHSFTYLTMKVVSAATAGERLPQVEVSLDVRTLALILVR